MNNKILKHKFATRRETSTSYINGFSKAAFENENPRTELTFHAAAVLLPIFQGPTEIELLLTQRAVHLKHHPGQVSFPGGRRELDDSDLEATAKREAFEETGIEPSLVEVVGHLDRMYTISFYDVDPVVAWLHPGFTLQADTDEVQEIFSVPLAHFAHSENQKIVSREVFGKTVAMVEFHYEGQRIWGATAAMIMSLIDVLWSPETDAA